MHHKSIIILFFAFLCINSANSTNTSHPQNANGDMFLNACYMEYPIGVFDEIGEVIVHRFLNPRSLAAAVVLLVIGLPYLMFPGCSPINKHSVKSYSRSKFILLHFLHRINYSITFIVALYCTFRQSRPCIVDGERIGGYYGMPSGDAMGGGIVTAFLFNPLKPVSPISIIAVIICFFVCACRVASGFHSIGMVLVGAIIGIALHSYSIRVPLKYIFVDAIITLLWTCITVGTDSTLHFGLNNQNNLWAWLVYGTGVQAFVCLMLYRFVSKLNISWKKTYKSILGDFDSSLLGEVALPSSDISDEMSINLMEKNEAPEKWDPDYKFTALSFCVLLLFQFFAVLVQVYNWIGLGGPGSNGGGNSPL